MRPDTGVRCRRSATNMIKSRPHQKIGIEKPVTEMPIKVWSYQLPRLTAAVAPAGTPISTANSMADRDSSTVAGNSVKNSVSTFSLVTTEVPKSPCNSAQT